MKVRNLYILVILMLANQFAYSQFLSTSGKKIIDHNGDEIILKGMGLGGWMLQEGYMLQTNSFANPQHEIEAIIEDLIGPEKTEEFYEAWLTNHCTKTDIDSLASWGFNSVRLPMHYKLFTPPIEEEPVPGEITWIDKGFEMVDELLDWCEANEMYLILDLHAAPGGQGKDAAISDYDSTKPSLWESDDNKAKTVALWRKLAERYADEQWMGGYDLINEPNWNFTGSNENGCDETSNVPLKELYVDIVEAIREVDNNHIIYIEGNCWANNHAGIWPPWDDNLVLSFHKYWSTNDQNSIQGFLDLRDQYNIPLWMGEAGENSNTWFKNAIKLFEDNDIGWAWWPMKKIGSVVNPMTIEKTDGYQTLLDYWSDGGTKPTEEFAYNALMEMAENLKIVNNTYRQDVIDAMIRQVELSEAKPFKQLSIPGTIHLTDFDLGGNGVGYYDSDTANYRVSTGTYTAWNSGWGYRNDGVDIEESSDSDDRSNGYNIGWTADGEWLQFTVNVESDGVYGVNLRYAGVDDSKIRLETNQKSLTETIYIGATGGYQDWETRTINDIVLYAGENTIRLFIEQGGVNLGFMDFFLSEQLSELEFELIDIVTNENGDKILLNANKRFSATNDFEIGDFEIILEGESVSIESVQLVDSETSLVEFSINEEYHDQSSLLMSYSGTGLVSEDGTSIDSFTDFEITNNRPFHHQIPVKIEAEDYLTNVGLVAEATTDEGEGLNLGYTNSGDYLEYRINVSTPGEYKLNARVACFNNSGMLNIQQLNSDRELLNETNLSVPVTGGWQTWTSVSTTLNLDEGIGILKVRVMDPEFNMNWFEFISTVTNSKPEISETSLYPNPLSGKRIYFDQGNQVNGLKFKIFDTSGKLLHSEVIENGEIQLPHKFSPGIYLWNCSDLTKVNTSGKLIIN
ncbi:MAG: carbohydrate-binding protein [bacterium]|nr:carbohydrate-binding protein [bacterium]